MAATLGTGLSKVLKQEIQRGSIELLQQTDAAHMFVKNSAEQVRRGEGIGRDWKWLQPVNVGIAGSGKFRAVDPANQWENAGTEGFPMGLGATAGYQLYPVHTDATFLGFHQYSVTLSEYLGNMFFPHNLLRADQLNATMVELVALNIKGFVRRKVLDELRMFYGQVSNKSIGTITLVSGGTTSDATAVVTLQDARVHMFPVGSTVDTYTTTTLDNAGIVVLKQDFVNKQLTLGTRAAANFGAALATGDTLVISGTALSAGVAGLQDWLVSTGSVQGVNTATLPQLLSLVDSTPQPLSEPLLNKYLGAIYDAYGPQVDFGVTTTGVVNRYADTLRTGYGLAGATASPYTIDRTTGPLKLSQGLEGSGGFPSISYSYGGKMIRIFASPFCPSGYAFFFKVGEGNILRLTPPTVPGMGKSSLYGDEVEFIAGYDGRGSIWKNYHAQAANTDTVVGTTDVVECPMSCVFNYAIKEPQGIKFTALTEDAL